MHYGIVAIGSRGDVQPYLALALGLKARGHQATIMAHQNFRDFVLGYGVGFHPLTGSVEELLKTDEGLAMLRAGSILAFARYLKKVINNTQDNVNRDLLEGAAKADILVSSLLGIPWIDTIAEKLGKPWAIVQLNLPTTRTSVFPLAALDAFDFPAYNRFTYRLVEFFHWANNKKPVNEFRRSLGLPGLQKPVMRRIAEEAIPNLYCFSSALCEKPADWPSQTDVTGFLFIPESERKRNAGDAVSPELRNWIDAGEPPVYIGFGSIPFPDPAVFLGMLKVLLQKTTHRFVFCQGWSMPMELPVNPRFYHVTTVNHEWLFPRCRVAVIHGGVGTTAAVLKAGIPVIIISIIADQPWWGKIIAKKGVGVHIPFRKITSDKLLAALDKTQMPSMRTAAAALGKQIAQDDGLQKTIRHLENCFGVSE